MRDLKRGHVFGFLQQKIPIIIFQALFIYLVSFFGLVRVELSRHNTSMPVTRKAGPA